MLFEYNILDRRYIRADLNVQYCIPLIKKFDENKM